LKYPGYVVYWQKENSEQEIRILLPQLYLKKPGIDVMKIPPAKKITGVSTKLNPNKF